VEDERDAWNESLSGGAGDLQRVEPAATHR
jgi:hypothetical protein